MKFVAVLSSALLIGSVYSIGANAQQAQPQPSQPQPTAQAPQHRILWIAKFTCDPKAASAVASTQRSDADALGYSSLFESVSTFEKDATQPQGTWSLTGNEVAFSGGSTAERALVGYGAGRRSITMEYKLTDPSGNVVWTAKIKTKPSIWGSAGALGAVQNQSAAEDEQAQKLIAGLSTYFGLTQKK